MHWLESLGYVALASLLLVPFIPAAHNWEQRLEQWDYENHYDD
jgi:hypothetical protein